MILDLARTMRTRPRRFPLGPLHEPESSAGETQAPQKHHRIWVRPNVRGRYTLSACGTT